VSYALWLTREGSGAKRQDEGQLRLMFGTGIQGADDDLGYGNEGAVPGACNWSTLATSSAMHLAS
jgi:hypothetical protein